MATNSDSLVFGGALDDAVPLFAFFWRDRPDCDVLAHFFDALRSDSFDRTQIVHALKRSVGLAHLRILSAVDGPLPGTCCSSSAVAVFRFTGRSGGFLLALASEPIMPDRR